MSFYVGLVSVIPCLLLIFGLIPTRWANQHTGVMRRLALVVSSLSLALSIAAVAFQTISGPVDAAIVGFADPIHLSLGVYFDSISAVMLLLVSFIGCVIVRFSIRYLDGDATQGRFLRWICFTLGAVILLIVSRNLLMFTTAWMMTSFGLHQLLTHYSDRPAALLVARKKFVISRLGDILLFAAVILTYRVFGTLEFGELFSAASLAANQVASDATSQDSTVISIIATLFVIGAMTKSAQFPFHSWLPDTLETPTPVSALMHAGIINAGGFLVIRLSPLVSLSPAAMDFLSFVGAFTALLGVLVMMTQTTVKRSLAYSTMAQMGFMMLQCGLGAFTAALLHIVAHSLYKAYAFLSSGSTIEAAALTDFKPLPSKHQRTALAFCAALATAVALVLGASQLSVTYMPATSKSEAGALVLGMVLVMALTQLLWKSFTADRLQVAARGIGSALVVLIAYLSAYKLMDWYVGDAISKSKPELSLVGIVIIGLVFAGFAALFLLQVFIVHFNRLPIMQRLYVHASNGFYFDITAHHVVRAVSKSGPEYQQMGLISRSSSSPIRRL